MKHDDVLGFDCAKINRKLNYFLLNSRASADDKEQICRLYKKMADVLPYFLKKKIHTFYFNHDDYYDPSDNSLYQTGLDFFRSGIVDMPHEICLYMIDNFVVDGDKKYTSAILIAKLDDGGREVVSSVYDGEDAYNFPYIIFEFDFSPNGECFPLPQFCLYNPMAENNNVCVFSFRDSALISRTLLDKYNIACGAVVASTMFLNTKYVDKQEVDISPTLNASREKRGKRPYSGYTIIKTKIKAGDNDAGGASGWTVRPHWRRGHIRHLNSGKITSVSPCMVNFNGDEIDPMKYVVKK